MLNAIQIFGEPETRSDLRGSRETRNKAQVAIGLRLRVR